MGQDQVEVRVHGVAADGGEGMPVVLLVDERDGIGVPVAVGPFEASAIIIELEGIAPPRPLTHDLLADLFRETGINLERAELYGERETGPLARLVYRRGLARRSREVRPSDAIALAIRLKAPILADRALLAPRSQTEADLAALSPDRDTRFLRAWHRSAAG